MPKDSVLDIVRRLQHQEHFREKILECDSEEKISKVLDSFNEDGIQIEQEDLLKALEIDRIIDSLKEETMMDSETGAATSLIQMVKQSGFDLGLNLQKGLHSVVKQIDKGYERVMTMYTVAFYLGVVLVLISVISSLVLRSDTSAMILGGLGMGDIIVSLIFRPTQYLQNSRSDLAQLQAAFFSWINDVHTWDRYLRLLDENATSNKQPPVFDKVREVSEVLLRNTEQMMALVERYCEVHNTPLFGKNRNGNTYKPEEKSQAGTDSAEKGNLPPKKPE